LPAFPVTDIVGDWTFTTVLLQPMDLIAPLPEALKKRNVRATIARQFAENPGRALAEMSQTTAFESELAELIVDELNLDIAPESIDPDAPLFGGGLELDSIDILEIALAVSKIYGFKLSADDPDNQRIFASLRALTAHIAKHRTR